ncbi:MAG TPA: T9SS type A sorting domain-containing protein [Chitinophagales bacterium]|nr:T9SS type A sorting domain-containing protein [Chitinophagales bacterium]
MKNKSLLINGLVGAITGLIAISSPVTTKAANGNCGFDTTITQSTGEFSTQVSGATYQWLYCATGLPITGATAQSYTPPFGGSYAVAITLNGCTDTTNCLQSQSIIATGIDEMDKGSQFNLFATNNGNSVSIKNSGTAMVIEVAIVNANGQTVLQQKAFISSEYNINTAQLPAGWYVVLLKTENTKSLVRFLKSL